MNVMVPRSSHFYKFYSQCRPALAVILQWNCSRCPMRADYSIYHWSDDSSSAFTAYFFNSGSNTMEQISVHTQGTKSRHAGNSIVMLIPKYHTSRQVNAVKRCFKVNKIGNFNRSFPEKRKRERTGNTTTAKHPVRISIIPYAQPRILHMLFSAPSVFANRLKNTSSAARSAIDVP